MYDYYTTAALAERPPGARGERRRLSLFIREFLNGPFDARNNIYRVSHLHIITESSHTVRGITRDVGAPEDFYLHP
jgi:hypothetical protein